MKLATQKRASTLFLLGLFVTSLLITPLSADPVNIPKFVSLVFFSSLCFGICISDIKLKGLRQTGLFGVATVIFIIGTTVVTVLSDSNAATQLYGITGRNIGLLTLIALALFMTVGFLLTSENLNRQLISTLIAITLISAVYGFIQFMNLDPLTWDSDYGRILGFFGNPNFQSAMLGLGGIALVGLIVTGNHSTQRLLLMITFIVLILVSMLISNSSQGFLVLLIGTTFILYVKFLKVLPRKVHGLFMLILLFGPLTAYLSLVKYFPTSLLADIGSINQRAVYWGVGFRIWQQNPIFGTGLDTFGESFRYQRNLKDIQAVNGTLTNSAHNYFIDVLANGGMVLFLPVLFLMLTVIRGIYRAIINVEKITSPDITIVGIWFGLFTQALISPNQIALMVWFWVCTGVVAGLTRGIHQPQELKENDKTRILAKKRNKGIIQLEASQILTSILSIIISLVISLPPYIASVRYLSALKSGQVEKIYEAALIFPMDVTRNVAIIEAFSKNQFYSQAHSLALITVEKYPNSFSAWAQLYGIVNALPEEKTLALLNMRRLDPNKPQLP